MSEVKFTLRLADGRWVSSQTNTVTNNPNLAGVFTAADDKSAAGLRRTMEKLHGPLEVVLRQSKRKDPAEAPDLFAGADMHCTRKAGVADGAEIDGCKAEREVAIFNPVPSLLTYPARPIQGGRLELAPPKRGAWYAEPKLNGWRALIHTPTGTMWNRRGALLTIADCFRPALASLANLAIRGLMWADCEALERRHNLGRGTLVVLDMVPEAGTPNYEQRRTMLETIIPTDAVFGGDASRPVPCGGVVLTPTIRVDSHVDALAFYQRLREANRVMACDLFEGVVMKRADSVYPVQLRSSTEECRAWVKHRFVT